MRHFRQALPCFALALFALPFQESGGTPQKGTEVQEAEPPPVPSGFEVQAATLQLRARALDNELEYARPAIEKLGAESLDRVTVELLMAVARGRDEARRDAAARALVAIAERAAQAHPAFAGSIGETLYLSSIAEDVRKRAYPLFMLLDNDSARRHGK